MVFAASRPFGRPPERPWAGKWTALRLDTVAAVACEVRDFVVCYRELKRQLEDGYVPYDGMHHAERRLRAMLRSAQLRLDVITYFYDANKKDPRSDRVKVAIRDLQALLQEEGSEADPFAPEVAFGPNTLLPSVEEGDAVDTPRRTRSKSRRVSSSPGGDREGSTSGGEGTGSEAGGSISRQKHEDALRARTLQKDAEIASIEAQNAELSGKLAGLEQENLRLERAMLELCESRERMKGVVEEQVYTVALMSKVSGLLHFELRRVLFRSVATGILFWCGSVVLLLHLLVSGGTDVMEAYGTIREQLAAANFEMWALLLIDCAVVCIVFGLLHEWVLFAEQDFHHGSLKWFIESLLMRKDDAIEAARTAAQRQTENIVNASHIDLSAYQKATRSKKDQGEGGGAADGLSAHGGAASVSGTNLNSSVGSASFAALSEHTRRSSARSPLSAS